MFDTVAVKKKKQLFYNLKLNANKLSKEGRQTKTSLTLKSVLLTCSKTSAGVLDCGLEKNRMCFKPEGTETNSHIYFENE